MGHSDESDPAVASPRDRRFAVGVSLRRLTARGTLINGAFIVGVNLLSMSRGLVMAGFLAREEYGVWGILLLMVLTLGFLRQVGIGERFVQQDEEDQELEFQRAFTLELIVSSCFAALGVVMMVAAAAIYDLPELVLPGVIMLVSLPLAALQMPLVVYARRMNFGRQRLLQASEPVVGFATTIGLAIAGVGYWSLVIGTVAGALAGAVVAAAFSPYRLRLRLSQRTARLYGRFSWPLFLAGFASVVMGQGIMGIGEATLGLAGAGVISLVTQISQFADRADRAVTQTIYPAICAVKDRTDLLLETFVKSNRIALMWGLPFGFGVAVFAEDVLRVFGPEWATGADLLRCIAITLAINQIGFNWTAFYRAVDNTTPIAVSAVVAIATACLVVFPLLAAEGLLGLGIGVLIAQIAAATTRVYYLKRLLPELRIGRHAMRALAPVLPAVVSVLALRAAVGGERDVVQIAVEMALFAGVIAGLTLRFERTLVSEVLGYLRPVKPVAPAA